MAVVDDTTDSHIEQEEDDLEELEELAYDSDEETWESGNPKSHWDE